MVTLNAHYDGKVIIPDEPLALTPNQKVRISIEPVETEPMPRTDWASFIGIARTADDRPHDPADEDALWENGPLPRP